MNSTIDTEELFINISKVSAELLKLVSSFDEEQLNTVPFEGSWTAAQVADHLYKAGSADVLYGNTAPTERDPGKNIPGISEIFLNFDIKMTSPDFIQPSCDCQNKETIYKKLADSWKKIREAAGTLDLSATCLDFELPGFGALTRFELISFLLIHTRRHLHQLKNIFHQVAGKSLN